MENNITITQSKILNLAILSIERQDRELSEWCADAMPMITDLDIYDFCRFHKAADHFNDQQFENTKAILLQFREEFQYGAGNFELGSLYKDRPSINEIF